jgi:hypothetical protein
MKLNAYILAADPAWIEASVLSYYDLVERIVVSYDQDSLGWTGVPIDVEQCLRRLRAIDRVGKMDYRPGHYARAEFFDRPMESETYQRQCALDQAGEGADWVLQLDTDEVIGSLHRFSECLADAETAGSRAINYPSLWIYARAGERRYLELCCRFWRRAAGYPGPLAVRAGEKLSHARRIKGHGSTYFHVDLSNRVSPLAFPNGIRVSKVVRFEDAVFHFSFVRSEQWLRRKFSTWGHAKDRDWHPEVERWLQASKSPLLHSLMSQFERGMSKRHLRVTRIPQNVESLLRASGNDLAGGSDDAVTAPEFGSSVLSVRT